MFAQRVADAVDEGIEAGGHERGRRHALAVAGEEYFDFSALVNDGAVARQRIEIGRVEDVALIGLVEDGDLSRIVIGQHAQDHAAHRCDSCVSGHEENRTAIIFRKHEIAVWSLDGHGGASVEFHERLSAAAGADANAELHRLWPLRGRGDRVRARDAVGKTEVHPLSGLERERCIVERHRDLHHARC